MAFRATRSNIIRCNQELQRECRQFESRMLSLGRELASAKDTEGSLAQVKALQGGARQFLSDNIAPLEEELMLHEGILRRSFRKEWLASSLLALSMLGLAFFKKSFVPSISDFLSVGIGIARAIPVSFAALLALAPPILYFADVLKRSKFNWAIPRNRIMWFANAEPARASECLAGIHKEGGIMRFEAKRPLIEW